MKIGIMTFHWATNYGAVLQAYALSTYLRENGYDVEIIRYEPPKYLTKISNIYQFRSGRALVDFLYKLRMEIRIGSFRKNNLFLSRVVSRNRYELIKYTKEYDCIIVGSDQIWNQSFSKAEGPIYYLEFAEANVRKVAYAASFGTANIDDEVRKMIKPSLREFSMLSVREYSGKTIIQSFGLDAYVVCDPVFLLPMEKYRQYASKSAKKTVFIYMLKNDRRKWRKVIQQKYSDYKVIVWGEGNCFSVEEWLSLICNSSLVVTDSFHGTAFSLLFNVPFYSVRIKGSGMNDRLETLLNIVGLKELLINSEDFNLVQNIPSICWKEVNKKISQYSAESKQYLLKALER